MEPHPLSAPSLGLCPRPWHQTLSPTDGLIIKTVELVPREMLDKSIITIIIIISELGIKKLKIPQFGGGRHVPRLCLFP